MQDQTPVEKVENLFTEIGKEEAIIKKENPNISSDEMKEYLDGKWQSVMAMVDIIFKYADLARDNTSQILVTELMIRDEIRPYLYGEIQTDKPISVIENEIREKYNDLAVSAEKKMDSKRRDTAQAMKSLNDAATQYGLDPIFSEHEIQFTEIGAINLTASYINFSAQLHRMILADIKLRHEESKAYPVTHENHFGISEKYSNMARKIAEKYEALDTQERKSLETAGLPSYHSGKKTDIKVCKQLPAKLDLIAVKTTVPVLDDKTGRIDRVEIKAFTENRLSPRGKSFDKLILEAANVSSERDKIFVLDRQFDVLTEKGMILAKGEIDVSQASTPWVKGEIHMNNKTASFLKDQCGYDEHSPSETDRQTSISNALTQCPEMEQNILSYLQWRVRQTGSKKAKAYNPELNAILKKDLEFVEKHITQTLSHQKTEIHDIKGHR